MGDERLHLTKILTLASSLTWLDPSPTLLSSFPTTVEILDTLDMSSVGQSMFLLLGVLQLKLFPFLSRVVGQFFLPLPPAMKPTLSS